MNRIEAVVRSKVPSLPAIAMFLAVVGSALCWAQRAEAAAYSRIALKIDNLLIVGNRISMATACVVETSLTDQELERRRIDPAQWRRDYCRQSLSIVESWARRFRRQGNFELLPRGAADGELAKLKIAGDEAIDPDALAQFRRRTGATHLLLVDEKITPRGRKLAEERLLKLIDLGSGDVLAEDGARF